LLLDLAPAGFAEEDGKLVVYTDAAGLAALRVTFSEVEAEPVASGWEDEWRRFHLPVSVGPLWVGPPWLEPDAGQTPVVVDPGRAFGTGAHETTRLCLELLTGLERGTFLDVGCGSGVLAIAAARLGFEPVTALDSDRGAVDSTLHNARDNGVALDRVERADLRREPMPAADAVVANLMRPLLLLVAELMTDPPRALILSGLLDHEADEVSAAFGSLRETRRLSDKGWTALLLTR
jgi:ribosomal protein L11 methyltransferase